MSRKELFFWLWCLCLSGVTGWGAAPSNDRCQGAIEIPPDSLPWLSDPVDVLEAGIDGEPEFYCELTNTVWYVFTPTVSQDYTISAATDTATTLEDTAIAVYPSGGSCGSLGEELDCSQDEAGLLAALRVTLEAGTTYYVVAGVGDVIEATTNASILQLRVSVPVVPGNDTCEGAELIPGEGPFPYLTSVADTTDAGTEGDPPLPSCAVYADRSVWYEFTPAESSVYQFASSEERESSLRDTLVAVFAAPNGCVGELVEVACDDAGTGRGVVSSYLDAGMLYYVVVWASFEQGVEPVTLGETGVQLLVKRFTHPDVVTQQATDIYQYGALLNALVNPNGVETTLWFEWGTTDAYGELTPPQPFGAEEFFVSTNFALGVPIPGLTYHYRAVATNLLGISYGEDESFVWDPAVPEVEGPIPTTNGTMRVRVLGVPRQIYWVEATSDFLFWTFVGVPKELTSGVFEHEDTAANVVPWRFYRAFAP